MKLYFFPGACSLASHITLIASNLAFTTEKVDLRKQPHTTENGTDFRTISPRGYVPALQLDNGELLGEGVAIMQYVADQVPEKGLSPQTHSLEHYRLLEWLNFIATEIHKSFKPLFYPSSDENKQSSWEQLKTRLIPCEEQLNKTPYLLNTGKSIADYYLFVCLSWVPRVGYALDDFPSLSQFVQRMKALPEVQQALKAEGIL